MLVALCVKKHFLWLPVVISCLTIRKSYIFVVRSVKLIRNFFNQLRDDKTTTTNKVYFFNFETLALQLSYGNNFKKVTD